MSDDELSQTKGGPNTGGTWRVRWLSGRAGQDFKLTPHTMPDGTLVFHETAPWAVVWWLIWLIPSGFVAFAAFDIKAWQAFTPPIDLRLIALSLLTAGVLVTTLYRLTRVALREKRLYIDPRDHTIRIVESWPRRLDVRTNLDKAQFLVRTLRFSGYRWYWSGYCLIVVARDAWFVLGADRVSPEAASNAIAVELRAIGVRPTFDETCEIATSPAK